MIITLIMFAGNLFRNLEHTIMQHQAHYYLTAICHSNRTECISKIEECIQKHASILDFNLFSDVSFALIIEIKGNDIPIVIHELKQVISIDENAEPIENCNYQLYLNITFIQGKGDLRHSIPEVPG